MEANAAIEISADDIPTGAARRDNKKLVQIARQLKQVLRMISAHLVLGEGLPKCNYFVVGAIREDIVGRKRDYKSSYMTKKEKEKRNNLRAVDRFEMEEFQ